MIKGRERRVVILTDASEVFDVKIMDRNELDSANRIAFQATDGNLYWVPVNVGLPIGDTNLREEESIRREVTK